ncbi:MAG: hypothetical protein Unbinned6046contig1000_46 [Prokaryotic dsDNA virus sp.]|nr:MAG: hypothetical protein Unbinned6046contig1000_46 [Prokaryotic dsDNA virus sp.]
MRTSHKQIQGKIKDSKASQNPEAESLDICKSVDLVIPKKTKFAYGYNPELDIVVISKDGNIGEVVEIQGLKIGLPKKPKKIYKRSGKKSDQYWEEFDYPKELRKISTVFQWNEYPTTFKNKYVDYIEEEFNRRDNGFWFKNRGLDTYITGSHYMYLQWTKIDVGKPEYREANRIFFIFWEACKADSRSYGMCYLKNRRSGFSYMSSAETVHQATISSDSRYGLLSKSGADAKNMFTDKIVPISNNYPFFFKPIQDGMDKPKSELAYRVPASKLTRKNIEQHDREYLTGLDTTIDWKNTGDNSYDGQKLQLLVHDESGKWEKPDNILNNWRVTKTCLRLGRRIVGKCMMGSTVNARDKGGENFKQLYDDSNVAERNANGQTKSGLYSLFIPMEWNMEGFMDIHGHPVFNTPEKAVKDIGGDYIFQGVLDYWSNEADALKNDPDALNEFYRQFPRTENHAFRDEAQNSLFNLTRIYDQIDHNDTLEGQRVVQRGRFSWKNGKKDTEVIWTPDNRGPFYVTWIPPRDLRNNVKKVNGLFSPGNSHIGAFGCDSYDISGTVGGGGSKGALHGITKVNFDGPSNVFFLEYISRPQTAELFFEDVLMALRFYGMPILVENNKPRLLYYLKNRGYRKFSVSRPDKNKYDLSKAERELGGIPSSPSVISIHAEAIESYINECVGYHDEGPGQMFFTRTLLDWANYDIHKRTKFDATVSSGLAIMATQRYVVKPPKKSNEINITFARYNNSGLTSSILKS